jgi:hypothetical protein
VINVAVAVAVTMAVAMAVTVTVVAMPMMPVPVMPVTMAVGAYVIRHVAGGPVGVFTGRAAVGASAAMSVTVTMSMTMSVPMVLPLAAAGLHIRGADSALGGDPHEDGYEDAADREGEENQEDNDGEGNQIPSSVHPQALWKFVEIVTPL